MSNPNTTQYDTLKAWADIVIEKWQAKMEKLKISSSGSLIESFKAEVDNQSAGNPEKITFTYLYYGRFPDMGVGKGVPLDMVGKKGSRKAKAWQGKIFFNQIQKLGIIMAEKLGQKAVIQIIEAFKDP